jgi:two-component system nitrate/nitrite response regulator NarL
MPPHSRAPRSAVTKVKADPGLALAEQASDSPVTAVVPEGKAKAVRVVVADDHLLFLHGLNSFLNGQGDLQVVAACENGKDALDQIVALQPDVALLDGDLPGLEALDIVRRLRAGSIATAVVIMTSAVDDQAFIAAIRLGVRGFLVKSMPPRLMAECVRQVSAGGYWLEKQATAVALEKIVRSEANQRRLSEAGLTRRETEIARLGGQGIRTAEIAKRLNISAGTVKLHLHQIYKKLGLSGRIALMVYARENGLG